MSTESEHIIGVGQQVIDSLQDDLVSAGELRQIIANVLTDRAGSRGFAVQVIRHLLAEGVEIGDARNIEGRYVKFIAWKGSVGDRCERAVRQVEASSEGERDFAFWLCLRGNVDEYEVA